MNRAEVELAATWGHGGRTEIGWAPGRCTLVGEHLDYVGGVIVAVAIDLGIEVAVRGSSDGRHRVVSRGRRSERASAMPVGDFADRALAATEVLRRSGLSVPALEIAISATLPEAAGLSSSAAVIVATLLATLRLLGTRIAAQQLVAFALSAERDIVGVPCGTLDPTTIVHAPSGGCVVLDCRDNSLATVVWPWPEVALVACATGAAHDVGGAAYSSRRADAVAALARLGVPDVQVLGVDLARLSDDALRLARHGFSESARARDAAQALQAADVSALGALMTASHNSLRDDYQVSTNSLDATVAATSTVPGCHGARLVGAGFGGSAVALVDRSSADACRAAMAAAAAVDVAGSTWLLGLSGGVASNNPDVVTSSPSE